MALNPNILFQAQSLNAASPINLFQNAMFRTQQMEQAEQQAQREAELQPLRERLLTAQTGQAEEQLFNQRDMRRIRNVSTAALGLKPLIDEARQTGDTSKVEAALNSRLNEINTGVANGEDIDSADTLAAITALQSGGLDALDNRVNRAIQVGQQTGAIQAPKEVTVPSELQTFQRLTEVAKGDPESIETRAAMVELGLTPRAGISADERIAASDELTDQVANSKSTIKQREKFGEMTGASRSKAIDSGFERVQKIDQNIANLDRAIEAVQQGAGTGAIERRFPSIKNSSVLLDQIQGQLALDVVGAVTFGALSEGELDLAKQVALPDGLDGPQLIEWLNDKKQAQTKLANYFREQIDFLDQGGTVAGFLRNKERQGPAQQTPASTQPQQPNIGRFQVKVIN